jgi:hypothetical protein
MLPPLYQKILLPHLNESQYLTLQLLLLLLQAHRQVKLSVLASVFPQRFSISKPLSETYNDF